MLSDEQLEQAIQDLIVDICEVMYLRGYDRVPIGAMMRLVGVAEERAAKHDQEYFSLDDQFKEMLKVKHQPLPSKAPSGATLH